MSTATVNFNRESICATCLSQDRKLIAMRDSRVCVLSYFELSLKLSDRVCWECHYFMRRMVDFKNRIQKAQDWLWKITNGQNHELHNLSTLTTSKGISLDIIPPELTSTDPCLTPDLKSEPPEPIEQVTIKEEVTGLDTLTEQTVAHPIEALNPSTSYKRKKHVRTPVAKLPNIIVTPLRKHADGNDGNCDIDDLANVGRDRRTNDKVGVEMRVFSHDKAQKQTVQHTINEDFEELLPVSGSLVAKQEPGHGTRQWFKFSQGNKTTTDNKTTIYTEKILSEEEMIQWRQEKAKTEFYSRSIPTERCETCMEVFDHERETRAHAFKHTEAYGDLVCDICQQQAIDAQVMAVHRKWHYRLLECRYCPFTWDNINAMRHHCSEMHNVPQVEWDCDQCERRLPSFNLWRAHERGRHRHAKCPDCGHLLLEANIKKHMQQHTGGLPFKTCPECGGQYRGEGGLRVHMLTHRTEVDAAAYCADCNTQYRSQVTYRAHLRSSKHATKEEYRFECDECGKKFLNITALRSHMDLHNGTLYPCQQCDRVYKKRNSRRNHVKLVHEGIKERGKHICDYCGRIFTTRTILTEHINSHTGARPHVCKICGDTFGYKSALYLHGRYKHKIQKITKNTNGKVSA